MTPAEFVVRFGPQADSLVVEHAHHCTRQRLSEAEERACAATLSPL
jgi:hypothetical protein